MKTFVEKFIIKENKTDLDGEYPNYIGEIQNEVMIPNNKLTYVNTPSMDLEEAIEILKCFKKKGANRVYFANHCDHRGYYFYGTKLIEI